jgi:hypothetical protein
MWIFSLLISGPIRKLLRNPWGRAVWVAAVLVTVLVVCVLFAWDFTAVVVSSGFGFAFLGMALLGYLEQDRPL